MRSRGKIIDATLDLIPRVGFDGVTIAAVAGEAGVSRQTVYSIFGSREELVSQAVSQLVLTTMEELRTRAAATETPTDFVVEIILVGRELAHANPVVSALLRGGKSNPLFDPGVLARAKLVTLEFFSPIKDKFTRIDEVAEMTVHLALSIILFDDPDRPEAELRDFLTRWLAPPLAQLRA